MSLVEPRQIALQFNDCINQQDIAGLAGLMTADHHFIDRAGNVVNRKEAMLAAWRQFFELFPEYKNTFTRVESEGNLVTLYGYATWKSGDPPDYAIWRATIEGDRVGEWRIDENPDGLE